jgi:hypothetical protein
LVRDRRCGRASPRVNAAYRWRRATTEKTSLPPFETRLLTSPLYRPEPSPPVPHPTRESSSWRCRSPGKRQQAPRGRCGRCCSDAAAPPRVVQLDQPSSVLNPLDLPTAWVISTSAGGHLAAAPAGELLSRLRPSPAA